MKNIGLIVLALSLSMITLNPLSVRAQLAKDKCKFLGNIIAGSAPSNFTTYWNQVTPENGGKWGSVEATRDVMNWGALDVAYNFAKNNGFAFKHHTFVWGQQQPSWIAELMANTAIPEEERYEEVRAEVEEWIRLFSERYPDTDYIDVVNEPFHATPSYDLALGSGWNWVIWTFQKARQYCPNAKLILNDYNIINSDGTTDSYVALINMLKAQNLIDGIGVQCHRFEIESTPVTQLKSNLDKLAATGLPVYITEFDVGNIDNVSTGIPTTDDNQQLEIYQRVFPVLWEHPGVHGITIWGYIEGQTWQSTAHLIRNNGTERPALTWLKSYIPSKPGGSFCLVTGIDEDQSLLTAYPNPATGGKIILKSEGPAATAIIRDPIGRIVKIITLSEHEAMPVYLEGAQGIYIIEVRQNQKNTYKKILVN